MSTLKTLANLYILGNLESLRTLLYYPMLPFELLSVSVFNIRYNGKDDVISIRNQPLLNLIKKNSNKNKINNVLLIEIFKNNKRL